MAASAAPKSSSPALAHPPPDEQSYRARFVASIDAGLADADADEVMDVDDVEAWLTARRQVATPERLR